MTATATERVLVIPTSAFREAGYFQGFAPLEHLKWDRLMSGSQLSYRPRSEMEVDPSFKQLIPYVIFRFDPCPDATSIFAYRRGKGQGEQRLHQKWSIGVGGHISIDDHHEDVHQTYQQGMQRELEEEVEIRTTYESSVAGMLNDDETEVGKVHLGVVHICDVQSPDICPRESEMMDACFEPLARLWDRINQMESWSRICLQALFPPP
jgi:predicted NUDIX family phosphoesterase